MNWQLVRSTATIASLALSLLATQPAVAEPSRVINPDFEIDADMSGNPDLWFRGGAVSYVTNDDSDGIGTSSVRSMQGGDWRSRAFAVTPGEMLTFSVDYKVAPGTTGTIRTDLRFFTSMSGGGTSGTFQGEFAPTTDLATVPQGVWNRLGPFTVTVPAGSAPPLVFPAWGDVRLSAGVFGTGLNPNGSVQFDRVLVYIPEPATCAMTLMAGLGLLIHRRRK